MFDLTKPKWIIQDNELRIGNVVNHADLAKENEFGGTPNVKGGGYWHWDRDVNVLYLFGKSIQYGQVSLEDFEDIWIMSPSLEKSTIYFSLSDSLQTAKANNYLIQDLNEGEVI